jgi:hypothetical protein
VSGCNVCFRNVYLHINLSDVTHALLIRHAEHRAVVVYDGNSTVRPISNTLSNMYGEHKTLGKSVMMCYIRVMASFKLCPV